MLFWFLVCTAGRRRTLQAVQHRSPVSYTHLDVYKRQSNYQFSEQRKTVARAQTFYRLRTSRTDPKIVSGLALAFGVGDQRCDQLQDVLFAMDIGERVIAVSYTHLDVYKRQLRMNSNECSISAPSQCEAEKLKISNRIHTCLLYTSRCV